MTWRYQPDENPKRRHHWKKPVPGFVEGPRGERVGKCPSDVDNALAEELINGKDRIEYRPNRWPHEYPKRIYIVFRGHLYRAHTTIPGESYHAFPEDPTKPDRVPTVVRKKLRVFAERHKLKRQLRAWL